MLGSNAGEILMEITLEELDEIRTNERNDAEDIIRDKIIKYAKQGYTVHGIVWMLCDFHLVDGKGRKEKIPNPLKSDSLLGEPIQVVTGNVVPIITTGEEE